MSRPAPTVHLFGVYLAVVGLILVVIPNMLLGMLSISPTDQPWIRILGVVVLAQAAYYIVGARHEVTVFFRASVAGRALVGTAILAIVASWGYWLALAFGLVDIAGALWTRSALADSQPTHRTETARTSGTGP